MKIPEATPLTKWNKATSDLSLAIGDNLLPLLTPLIEGLAGLVRGFGNMPEPLQTVAIGLGAVGLGIGAIKVTTQTLGGLSLLIKSLRDVATAAKAAQAAQAVGDVASLGRTSVNPFQVKPLANTLKPPSPGMFAGFLKEVGTVAKAFGGLTLEAGKFFLKLAVEIPGVARLGSVFAGLRIGATIAGWAGAIGPFVGTFMAAMGGIMTFMTGTVLPTLVGIFSGPVGWIALAAIALGTAIYVWREPIGKFIQWIWDSIPNWIKEAFKIIYDYYTAPWLLLWKTIQKPVSDTLTWMSNNFEGSFKKLIKLGYDIWLKPWIVLWNLITGGPKDAVQKTDQLFENLYNGIIEKWRNIPAFIQKVWDGVLQGMSRVWRQMINGATNALNGLIQLWNGIADKVNVLPGPLKLPIIPLMTSQPLAEFARGGFVDRPTLGWIGEGPNPREYAIPEHSMDAAAAGWQAGLRGERLVKAFQNGSGLTPGSSLMSGSGGGGSGGVPGPVNITISGGVTQLPDGRQMVSLEQVQAIAQAYSRQAMGVTVRLLGGR